MKLSIHDTPAAMADAAAGDAAALIADAIARRGTARVVAATGTSQFEFLARLTSLPGIDWPRVELFHLDEYIGLPISHPASFRRIILERLVRPTGIRRYHLLDAETDPGEVCARVGAELTAGEVDVAFVGIGENGHLAFNDPPADFTARAPYIQVRLDDACRRQQVGEGWFAAIDEVPATAVSMSIPQILRSRRIVAVVPDARKAPAVKAALEGPIGPEVPASILRTHPCVALYLDAAAAAGLSPATRARYGA